MNCPKCDSGSCVKCGKDVNGFQRFRCNGCGKKFTEPHAMAGKHTSVADAAKVLGLLLEGMSIRACERVTGMNRDKIIGLVVDAGESCQRFMEAAIRKVPVQMVECDEQWAFVFCKRRTAIERGYDADERGDRFVFTALDRDSKLLLCWHAGQRSPEETWRFADKLYAAVSGRPTVNTDGFGPYTSAIPLTFRFQVDYAQVVKNFRNPQGKDSAVRYSPGAITSITKKVVCGDVMDVDIGTSRMERFNLTTRMQVRRFTRLTNAHSKKTRNHDAMLGMYFAWYNWCRHHSTIKATPAVKAGIATERWTLERLLTESGKF